MKTRTLCTVLATLAASVCTPQVFAQAPQFEGLSLLLGYNAGASTVDVAAKANGSTQTATSTTGNGSLQAEYTLVLAPQITFGAGLNVGLGDLKFGTWSGSNTDMLLRDTMAIYVTPGYALNSSTLLYGKVASITGNATNVEGVSAVSLTGMGYGLGARIINGNVFYQIEYMQNQYSDRETTSAVNKFKGSLFSFGLGYKF